MSERLQPDVGKRGRADGPKDVTIATSLSYQQLLCATIVALNKDYQCSITPHYTIFRKMHLIFFILPISLPFVLD